MLGCTVQILLTIKQRQHIFLIASLLSMSGCALPGDTLHMLYKDIGRAEFEHLDYTQARIDDSHLFLEIAMQKKKSEIVHVWTSFPWTALSRLKDPSEYNREECYSRNPGVLFSIYDPVVSAVRNPSPPSHQSGFGFSEFSPIELGGMPEDVVGKTTAISLSHPSGVKRKLGGLPAFVPFDERLEIPAAAERLNSIGDIEIVAEIKSTQFLLAVPESGDSKPRSVYLLSGAGLCRERYARREWWSYPVMIVGTPIALASDLALAALEVPRLAMLGTLLVVGAATRSLSRSERDWYSPTMAPAEESLLKANKPGADLCCQALTSLCDPLRPVYPAVVLARQSSN